MGTVEFYYHCPSEVITSGTNAASGLATWLLTNHPVLQQTLASFLALTGRADEDAELSVASYLASATTQPLHSLVADITASAAAMCAPVVPGQKGYFNFKGGYLHFYASRGPEKAVTPVTVHFLRHLVAGDVLVLQIKGDPFTEYQRAVLSVSGSSVTFDQPDLPDVELIAVSAVVPDVERVNDVIVFRQYDSFDMSTYADESTFNPPLYMLLYRAISPEIVGMTATQLFQHFTNAVSRIGSVEGLRAALSSPRMSDLEITNLLRIGPGAAIQFDGVAVRNVTTFADVLAQNSNVDSDTSLLTAKASATLLENRMSAFSVRIDTDILNANTVNAKTIVATEGVHFSGSFRATPTDVIISTPVEVPSLTTSLATVRTLRAAAVLSDDLISSNVSANNLRAGSASIDGTLESGSIYAREINVSGSTQVGALHARTSITEGTAKAEKVLTNELAVSGVSYMLGTNVTGDLRVSGKTYSSSIEIANGGFEVMPSGEVVVGTRLTSSLIEAAVLKGMAVDFMEAHVKNLTVERVQSDRARVQLADIAELTLGQVVGDLIGANVVDARHLIVRGSVVAENVDAASMKTTGLDVVDAAKVGTLHVLEDIVCDVQLKSRRTVTDQLDVPGRAFLDTLAVSGVASVAALHVSGDTLSAGNYAIAGLLDANRIRIRGDMTVSRGVFSDGAWIEWGDLVVSRGNASVFGNVSIGGKLAVEDAIYTSKGLSVTSGGVDVVGNANISGDVAVSGSISAVALSLSGNAHLGKLVADNAAIGGGISAAAIHAKTIHTESVTADSLVSSTVTCEDISTVNSTVTGKSTQAETYIEGDLDIRGTIRFGSEPVVIPTSVQAPVAHIDEANVETIYAGRIGIGLTLGLGPDPTPTNPTRPSTPVDLYARLAAVETELAALRAFCMPLVSR